MIIEIGTSDFRTEAGKVDGIFIEPVKYYFDRLPECNKENVAISNKEGELDIFYMTEESIKRFNLPNWVRGCNSINHIHPSVKTLLEGMELPLTHVRRDKVKVVRIKSIILKYNVQRIDLLKIDTEGHDCVILNDFLDSVTIKPKIIQFENNVLSNKDDVKKVVARLRKIGYNCTQVKDDIVCKL